MKQSLKNIALTLDKAAFQAKATAQISEANSINLTQAYQIQAASLEQRHERGEQLTGFKLGFTSKAKMEQMGVHEIIWGRLTDKMEVKSGADLEKTKFIHPRVEPEIAFLIGQRIDAAITLETATNYLAGVAGALEIIDSRYENFKFSLEDVVADNCSSAAYVIGEWKTPNTPIQDVAITLEINNKSVQQGNSNAILGNPMESLVEIARILTAQGIAMEEGMIILAGAATSAVYVQPKDKIVGRFASLGTVQLNVV